MYETLILALVNIYPTFCWNSTAIFFFFRWIALSTCYAISTASTNIYPNCIFYFLFWILVGLRTSSVYPNCSVYFLRLSTLCWTGLVSTYILRSTLCFFISIANKSVYTWQSGKVLEFVLPEFELNCSFLLPINPIALTSFYLDCTVYFLLHFSLNECVSASTQVLANLESRFFINFHLRKKKFWVSPWDTFLFNVFLIISLKREYFFV